MVLKEGDRTSIGPYISFIDALLTLTTSRQLMVESSHVVDSIVQISSNASHRSMSL
jgi:hypothetical protein